MSLKKLDEVIEELEEQSKTFKNYNEAYNEIIKIKQNISNSNSVLERSNLILDESSKDITENFKKINTEVSIGYESIKKINIENSTNLEEIVLTNLGYSLEQSKQYLTTFELSVNKREEEKKLEIKNNQKTIENILDEQSKTNKLFYKDLSGEVYSRLERSKLDLKINITKNNELLETKIKKHLDENVELISKIHDEKQKMLGKKINKMQLFIMFLLFVNITILFTMFLVMKY